MDAVAVVMDFILKKNFRLEKQSKSQEFPYAHSLPNSSQPPQRGVFVTIHEPSWTHYYHPKFVIEIKLHSWCCTFCGFGHTWASQVVLVVKNPPANAGDFRDSGSIPGSGRPPGGGNGNPLQYSCLENPMNRGAWQATVHGVAKSQTQLKQLNMHA